MEEVLVVLMRWFHVVAAALAIGGVFFMRIVLPVGLQGLPDEQRREAFLRCRRVFKMVIHTCILLLLASGVYNTMRNWGVYGLNRPVMHGLWGPHLLLGLLVFGISIWLLKGKEPPKAHATWAAVNLALLLTAVAVAGMLKFARDRHVARHGMNPLTQMSVTPATQRSASNAP